MYVSFFLFCLRGYERGDVACVRFHTSPFMFFSFFLSGLPLRDLVFIVAQSSSAGSSITVGRSVGRPPYVIWLLSATFFFRTKQTFRPSLQWMKMTTKKQKQKQKQKLRSRSSEAETEAQKQKQKQQKKGFPKTSGFVPSTADKGIQFSFFNGTCFVWGTMFLRTLIPLNL
jgi:hypothetical protein